MKEKKEKFLPTCPYNATEQSGLKAYFYFLAEQSFRLCSKIQKAKLKKIKLEKYKQTREESRLKNSFIATLT